MLTGKLPFSGSAAELMYQHQHAALPVEKLKSVPKPLITLVQTLLAKDPNQRFQTREIGLFGGCSARAYVLS
jgi:hypothetical protein